MSWTGTIDCPHCRIPCQWDGEPDAVGFLLERKPVAVICGRCGRTFNAFTEPMTTAEILDLVRKEKPCGD